MAGAVAAGKLEGLLAAGAQVTVVAPEIRPELEQPGVALERRAFEDARSRRRLVGGGGGAARGQPAGAGGGRARGSVFVNAVDDPAARDGVSRRRRAARRRDDRDLDRRPRAGAGGLLREALDAWLPGDLDEWMAAADEARRTWKQRRRADGAAAAACCSRR